MIDLLKNYIEAKDKIETLVNGMWEYVRKYSKIKGYLIRCEIDESVITFHWEETWSYGGHDSGSETWPTKLLFSDYSSFFNKMIKDDEEKLAKQMREEEKAEIRRKKRLLAQLQKEVGGSDDN